MSVRKPSVIAIACVIVDQGWLLACSWPIDTGYPERSIAIVDSLVQFDGASNSDWSQSWNTEIVQMELTPPRQNP